MKDHPKSRRIHKPWALVTVAIAAVALSACSSSTQPDAAPTETPTSETGSSSGTPTCDPVSVALPTSTEGKVITYAITNNKLPDQKVPLDIQFLEVPALIQATGTDQFDLLQTSLVGFAGAVDKGAPLKIVAPVASRDVGQDKIVVAAASDIESVADLKGRTMSVGSLGSTVTTLMRMALAKESGLSLPSQGGDIQFVELPDSAALAGLTSGSIDASFVYQQGWWKIQNDSDYRELADVSQLFQEGYGFLPFISLMITTDSLAATKAECIVAANEQLVEASDWARNNVAEVAESLAATEGVSQQDLSHLIETGYKYGGLTDADSMTRAQQTLQAVFDAGEMKVAVPNLTDYLVK